MSKENFAQPSQFNAKILRIAAVVFLLKKIHVSNEFRYYHIGIKLPPNELIQKLDHKMEAVNIT
jgi:hypothetical protein